MIWLLKRCVPLCSAAVAAVWIYCGVARHGVWDPIRGPMSGFFPTLVAALLLIISVIAVIQADGEALPVFKADYFLLIGAVAALYGLIFVVGMLPAVAVFLVAWLRWVERYPWRTVLGTAAVIAAIVFGVFVLWLGVLFPQGLLVEAFGG